jgi:hypothetical protein
MYLQSFSELVIFSDEVSSVLLEAGIFLLPILILLQHEVDELRLFLDDEPEFVNVGVRGGVVVEEVLLEDPDVIEHGRVCR